MAKISVEAAVFVKASRLYNPYFEKSADQVFPYSLLAKPICIPKSTVPAKPILIARTSTSIVMKLPFFRPITEYKSWQKIAHLALYGKPSGSGVAVSLNNTDYDGTGEKFSPGAVVKVTGLQPNENFVFAAGGFTSDSICVNGIGETSSEILACLPLPLTLLTGYLAETAFNLGHYQIAKQASELLCSQFIKKSDFEFSFLDHRMAPQIAFRLDKDYLNLISVVEAK